jgi:hypothetical protein
MYIYICTYPGSRVAQWTKVCKVTTSICESSVRNLFHVTLLGPKILRCLEIFGKFVYPWH